MNMSKQRMFLNPFMTDKSCLFAEKFHQNIKNPFYMRPKSTSLNFSIAHYAGIVHYDAVGFLEKNRDRLPVEIVNLLRASDSAVVRSLFQTPLTKTGRQLRRIKRIFDDNLGNNFKYYKTYEPLLEKKNFL